MTVNDGQTKPPYHTTKLLAGSEQSIGKNQDQENQNEDDLRFRNLHQQQEDGQQQADEQIGEVLSDYVNEDDDEKDISEQVQKITIGSLNRKFFTRIYPPIWAKFANRQGML